ncbi:hypothetical protein H012_gp482 [Acanthamoeba polyphaga moumouvirus]|uniref:NET domain-containing protein n=2 Tax=Moumouvirus TaxID=3080801 RepID=L7RD32_9VIRU|nr:hypothetical protein H012_gp482 [Acanthamoeba polyphaga moumouvirus]AEX62756.1 hypothetical protein mv_R551 [Moumouvirus Monve]AGC01978.1 hypothetical protein Moumou_00442 [Acanthamoeba polyphaga moumouvirus]AQN68345.1 hypothetical protein [Saudi moumouvirus]
MNLNKSKYSRDDRKHIVESIENLKNDKDYVAIFKILMNDSANSYTQNSNGVFLNLSLVSDDTLDQISKYLKKINKTKKKYIDLDVDVIPNYDISKNERVYKLSNYEKNIIKQRNLKKVLEEDNQYEELRFSAKKSSNKKSSNKKSSTKKTSKKHKQEILDQ